MKKKLISVNVPVYNPGTMICRLLDSVLRQGKVDDVEVVLADDNSTDGWQELVKPYEDKIDIVYTKTNVEVHCPSNTRQAALEAGSGEWILMIDNDDYFEDGAFDIYRKYIPQVDKHWNTVIWGTFYGWNEEKGERIKFYDNTCWTHGNLYNREFLRKNNINFPKNLESNEDGTFNTSCGVIIDFTTPGHFWIPKEEGNLYRWVWRSDSLSRAAISDSNLPMYMNVHLKEYLWGNTRGFIDWYKEKGTFRDSCLLSCIFTLFLGFLYYQGILYREKKEHVLRPDRKRYLRRLWDEMEDTFGCTKDDAIFAIYNDANKYAELKILASDAVGGLFVESQSWKDFIKEL